MRTEPHKPALVSSHPDADPEGLNPPEAAVDYPSQEDFAQKKRKQPKREPIVSINGTDVNPDDLRDEEAA